MNKPSPADEITANGDDGPCGDLCAPITTAYKPVDEWRVGLESERFGVFRTTGRPIAYDGNDGLVGLFAQFASRFRWEPHSEVPGGPTISLHRGRAAITLEPGGQLEFSGSPHKTLHELEDERIAFMSELKQASRDKLYWIASGFHPTAAHSELPSVPKQRYGVMASYLPTQGKDALEMMRRTATVQANLDFSDAEDALRKLRVSLRLSPVVNTMFANAPFLEGRRFDGVSRRLRVWLAVDPHRQGLLPQMWRQDSTLQDYVQWALDAPMFMFVRDGEVLHNTGQSFRSFLKDGYEGHRATQRDWVTHLNTMFPEVRLKGTLELRGADSVPQPFTAALPAVWTGLLYDADSLAQAEELSASWSYEECSALRAETAKLGLSASFRGQPLARTAETLLGLAQEGLDRRNRLNSAGKTESIQLQPLQSLVAMGKTPADLLTERAGGVLSRHDLLRVVAAEPLTLESTFV